MDPHKSEKQLTKWQQQVKDDIAWTNSAANYIGLNPEDLWASALEARDKRIAELEGALAECVRGD